MVFKGSTKYPSPKIVSETIDSMGAENNAGTSKEWTNFWIKTATINLEKAFDILGDTVLNPLLKQEEIDRERGVIYQEIAMYEDTPIASIGEEFEGVLFGGDPLGRKISGNKKTLVNINRDEFITYRDNNYIAENILVSVAGGAKLEDVQKLAEKYFSGIRGKKAKNKDYSKPVVESGKKVFLKNKKTDQGHFTLGFRTEGKGYKGRYAQSILSAVLGKGMSSRLFTEVRERRGLAYAVRTSIERYSNIGEFDVYAGVELTKIEEAIKVVLDQIFGLSPKKYRLIPNELQKAKNYIKGKLALSLEDSSAVNDFFSEQVLFEKEVLTPKDVYDRINKVKEEDVYEEAKKMFKKTGIYLAVIGPYTSKDKLEKLIQ
jgi:predicted Zn-dependent peptidase